ncbi:hypothetical protein [Sulfuricurvum sp.]|uniref:hypothetical protein n=1 Tax=Sulfuricurvum sp. TaxID=2025608 RepID=UPI003C5904B3
MRRIAKAAAVIAIAVLPNWAYAGVEVAACCDSRGYCGYAVGSSWNDSLNGTRYLCKCTSGGGTCSPTSSGGSSGGSYGGSSGGGGGSSKDLWKYQMMQGIVSGLMQGLMQGLENQQREEAQRAEQQRQQQEAARLEAELQRQKTEAEKRAAKEAWEKKRKEAARAEQQRKEEEARDGANLAAKMGSTGGGLQLVSLGGTGFFGSKTGVGQLDFKPMAAAENDASSLSALQRAVCSNQFLTKANRSGSNEDARYYSDQAERVMSGGKYSEACNLSEGLPQVPEAPVPEPLWSPEEMAFFKKVEEARVQMEEKALQIQEIEAKVTENKEKIDDAKAKKEQADAILKDLQNKAASTDDPAKKAEIDTLLAEANALLSEAEMDSLATQQENEKLLSDKQKIEQSMQETKKMLEAQIPKPNTAQGAENEKR